MKREHIKNGGSIQPTIPFAENLVFYAPLTQGDLTDHISGSELQVKEYTGATGTISFDQDKQMYYFFHNYVKGYCFTKYKWTGLSMGLVPNNPSSSNLHCTIFFKYIDETFPIVNNKSYSRFNPSLFYVEGLNNYVYAGSIDEKTSFISYFDHTLKDCALVVNGTTTYFYIDHVLVATKNSLWLANGQTYNSINNRLSIYPIHDATTHGGAGWMKDIRVYNRALSANEIAQL